MYILCIVTAVIVNVSKYYIQSGFLLEKIYHHFKNINITSAFQTSGLSYDCNKIFLNINFNIMCLGNNRSITCISYQNTSKCRPAYSVHRLLNGGAGTTLHVLHFLPEPDVLQTVLSAQKVLKFPQPLLILHQIEETDGPPLDS